MTSVVLVGQASHPLISVLMPIAVVKIIQLHFLKIRRNSIMLQILRLIREFHQKEDILCEISTENL
jgi:hypothetical protein